MSEILEGTIRELEARMVRHIRAQHDAGAEVLLSVLEASEQTPSITIASAYGISGEPAISLATFYHAPTSSPEPRP